MRRSAILVMSILAAACSRRDATLPEADPRGCIAATLEHEEHTDDPDGVSHDVRYRERFIRCEGRVWIERILPAGATTHTEPHGHREMPPLHLMARLVTKEGDGSASLTLVSNAEKQVIRVTPESFDGLRFDGDFDAAAHIVSSRAIHAMDRAHDRAAPAGAEWREKTTPQGFVRILWSPSLDMPLDIESGAKGGAKRDHIRVVVDAMPKDEDLPWRHIDGFEHKSDQDFLD
jgi:hypothetical protein